MGQPASSKEPLPAVGFLVGLFPSLLLYTLDLFSPHCMYHSSQSRVTPHHIAIKGHCYDHAASRLRPFLRTRKTVIQVSDMGPDPLVRAQPSRKKKLGCFLWEDG